MQTERPRSAVPHEITRTTTAERAKLVRVESYAVALDLTRGDEHFGSTSVIRFSCARPGADSHADLRADKVYEIILNGRLLDTEQVCADGRIALADLQESNELRVVADFRYTAASTRPTARSTCTRISPRLAGYSPASTRRT